MDIGQIFIQLFINPFTNVLVALYQGLVYLHAPFPLGFSIILLTILIRFIMYPLISSQTRQMHKMQSLNPHLSKIKESQTKELIEKGLIKTLELENEFTLVLAYIEFCGFKLDKPAWEKKVLRQKKELEEKKEISPEILKIIWETYLQIIWIIPKS